MADKNQNKAELYRKERKERLAKAAKKNAKNIEKKTAARAAVKKVVAIILAVAVALGCIAGILSYSGITQTAIQIGGVGSEKISYAEYKYYYFKIYNQVYSSAKEQSQQYGSSGGYDVTLTPAEQTTTAQDKEGNEITWVEYFQMNAVDTAQMFLAYYQEAKKEGLSDRKSVV